MVTLVAVIAIGGVGALGYLYRTGALGEDPQAPRTIEAERPPIAMTAPNQHESRRLAIAPLALVFVTDRGVLTADAEGGNATLLVASQPREIWELSAAERVPYVVYDRIIGWEGRDSSSASSNVFLLDLETRTERRLTRDGNSRKPAISPDGTKVVFEKTDWRDPDYGCCGKGVWLLDLETGRETRLAGPLPASAYHRRLYHPVIDENVNPPPRWTSDGDFAWFEEGAALAFSRKFGKGGYWLAYATRVAAPSAATELGAEIGAANAIVDARRNLVLFQTISEQHWKDGFQSCVQTLYLYDSDTAEHRPFLGGVYDAAISPDGDRVVVVAPTCPEGGSPYTIDIVRLADMTQERIYGPIDEWPAEITWSLDGAHISFVESGETSRLLVVDPASGEVRTVSEEPRVSRPVWVPREAKPQRTTRTCQQQCGEELSRAIDVFNTLKNERETMKSQLALIRRDMEACQHALADVRSGKGCGKGDGGGLGTPPLAGAPGRPSNPALWTFPQREHAAEACQCDDEVTKQLEQQSEMIETLKNESVVIETSLRLATSDNEACQRELAAVCR